MKDKLASVINKESDIVRETITSLSEKIHLERYGIEHVDLAIEIGLANARVEIMSPHYWASRQAKEEVVPPV